MLHAGLDLSRKRLDFHVLDEAGETVEVGAAPLDGDGLRGLAARLARHRQPLRVAIESMTGARIVHDQLELHGWEVEIADADRRWSVSLRQTPTGWHRPAAERTSVHRWSSVWSVSADVAGRAGARVARAITTAH